MRTQVWMTERALWTEAVERAPDKIRPKIQLARVLPAAQALELLGKARGAGAEGSGGGGGDRKDAAGGRTGGCGVSEFGRALALDPHNALLCQ